MGFRNLQEKLEKYYPLILYDFPACIGSFSLGTGMGWTSPALPFLTKCNGHNDSVNFNPNLNNCTLINPFTEEEGSWMGSLFAIGKRI